MYKIVLSKNPVELTTHLSIIGYYDARKSCQPV